MGRALALGRRRLCRGHPVALRVRGAALTLGVAALAGGAGLALEILAGHLGIAGLLLQAVALKSTLALRGLAVAAERVATALDRGELAAARVVLARDLVSRSTDDLAPGQAASAAVESVAENLTDGFVAPLGFFVVFGLPGALAYRAVNTADAMLGYREGALEDFGKAAARLDDLLNLLPARLAASAIVLSAWVAGGGARRAFGVMRRDHGVTASPNAGWTMAAMAGALGVAVEKPGAYRLGEGALPTAAHVRRSVRITLGASALAAAAAVLVEIIRIVLSGL
jgi:adenosylcobinamide-phosphate synthase